ncbi:hypothetical protein [Streptomyces sp. NPDC050422]|uniref:hypothetical protein n=1 Tax=Streptomyces sp. NPDC050422 TaxID=3365614 RepID=UPI0037992297
MAKPLNALTVQRLAYVRYLYQEGIEQSRRPAPLSSSALLSFHDAVENFLGLAAEHLQIEVKPGITFVEYWGILKPAMELPGKTHMKRLNDARISLKHHGNFPSAPTIERAREAVIEFFASATPQIFSVGFDQIGMIDLVIQGETARLLREAHTHAGAGDYVQAAAGLYLAFEELLTLYAENSEAGGWRQVPFAFGPTLAYHDRVRNVDIGFGTIEGGINKLMDMAQESPKALRMISLGIDYSNYARFAAMVPRVDRYMAGLPRYVVPATLAGLSEAGYSWARGFVIESALRAANADGIRDLLDNQKKDWNPSTPWPERSWEGAVVTSEDPLWGTSEV